MHTDESIGITYCIWTYIPWGGFIYMRHPLGMICLYGKVMVVSLCVSALEVGMVHIHNSAQIFLCL